MKRPGILTIAALSAAASLLACNQPLDPRGPLQKHLFNRAVGAYKNLLYRAALTSVAYKKYDRSKVIFKWTVFQLVQVEQNLYNYYQVAHVYNDPHSMRLDEPMFSSLRGGVGLVGAYTLDSLVHLLPETFAYNTR